MSPIISVIVPVYNAEAYLHQCINSILGQDLRDLELILINDGSTDCSGSICDQYANSDNRVKVVHQKNGGVSKARNKGIEISCGEYIGFVDADDWVELNMYSKMLDMVKHYEADLGICSFRRYDGIALKQDLLAVDNQKVFLHEAIKEKLLPAFISAIDLQGNRQDFLESSVCKCVFRRDLIQTNQSFFNPQLKNREDVVFFIQALSSATRVAVSQQPFYHYRQDVRKKDSVTQRYMPDAYKSLKISQEEIEAVINKIGYTKRMQKPLAWSNCMLVLNAIRNLCALDSPYSLREKAKLTRKYMAECNFKYNVDAIGDSFFRRDHKILVYLLRHSFIITVNIFYTIRHKLW